MVQETVKVLADCDTEVVLTHFNHTNPILSEESVERAMVLAKGFKVGHVERDWMRRHTTYGTFNIISGFFAFADE